MWPKHDFNFKYNYIWIIITVQNIFYNIIFYKKFSGCGNKHRINKMWIMDLMKFNTYFFFEQGVFSTYYTTITITLGTLYFLYI